MGKRQRLDALLVEKGYFESREKAKASIMAGLVFVDGIKIDKPGAQVDPVAELKIQGQSIPYVSRGGLKLAKALNVFGKDLSGKTVLDIGASTGGFTDCALQHGAKQVYAIDVGYGQLAWKLRLDPRVINLERTNIRYLTPEQLNVKADLATIDVSFISLTKIIGAVKNLLSEEGEVIALIKPQFEAGKEKVGKKGVVRDKQIHKEVIEAVTQSFGEHGFCLQNLTFSPIKGPEGNIEYLANFQRQGQSGNDWELQELIQRVVEEAHAKLLS